MKARSRPRPDPNRSSFHARNWIALMLVAGLAAAGVFAWRLRSRISVVPTFAELQDTNPDVVDLVRKARREVSARPADPTAWAELGMVCEANNLLGLAREAFERSIALDGAQPRTHYRLAIVGARIGDIPLALRE